MRIHFGKYKGEKVEDVPSDYLYWFLNNVEQEDTPLYKEMDAEYNERDETNTHWYEGD